MMYLPTVDEHIQQFQRLILGAAQKKSCYGDHYPDSCKSALEKAGPRVINFLLNAVEQRSIPERLASDDDEAAFHERLRSVALGIVRHFVIENACTTSQLDRYRWQIMPRDKKVLTDDASIY